MGSRRSLEPKPRFGGLLANRQRCLCHFCLLYDRVSLALRLSASIVPYLANDHLMSQVGSRCNRFPVLRQLNLVQASLHTSDRLN